MGNNNDISYAFVDGSTTTQTLGNFAINANTGVITVASAPTFLGTAADTRTLTIRATETTAGATGQTRRRDYYNHRNAPRYIYDSRHS